jgi:hypothetical protein
MQSAWKKFIIHFLPGVSFTKVIFASLSGSKQLDESVEEQIVGNS